MNSVVLVESQGSCALVRMVRLQKFDWRDNMIFTVHLNRLIDENTPLEQSTIETCLQEAYKSRKLRKFPVTSGQGSKHHDWTASRKGALKKKLHQQPQKKKGGRKRQCPALCEVCLRPSAISTDVTHAVGVADLAPATEHAEASLLRCNAAFAILYCAEAAVPESIVRLYAVITVTD